MTKETILTKDGGVKRLTNPDVIAKAILDGWIVKEDDKPVKKKETK